MGTGGADLDACPKNYTNTHTYKTDTSTTINYKSAHDRCNSTHGDLKVKLSKHHVPTFEYKPVS